MLGVDAENWWVLVSKSMTFCSAQGGRSHLIISPSVNRPSANCGCTLLHLCLTFRGIQAWWYVSFDGISMFYLLMGIQIIIISIVILNHQIVINDLTLTSESEINANTLKKKNTLLNHNRFINNDYKSNVVSHWLTKHALQNGADIQGCTICISTGSNVSLKAS